MSKVLMAVFAMFIAFGVGIGNAEAARFGGGKSFGMQRQAISPRPAPTRQVAPTSPTSTPTAAPKRNWMGPIAGLAAGLGIAALLSHLGMGAGMANIVMIALLAMAAVFVFRLLFRRNAPTAGPANSGLQYAGAGRADMNTPFQAQQFGSASPEAASPVSVPEGFDSEAFVRIAKLNFVRLQAANDEKNIDDIREFTSPELFAEIKMQMTERGDAPQQTDVVTLNAELLEVTTEANRHIASVRFSGMIREAADASAEPFEEIWNLSKPVEGNKGWVISGIQQAA
jgi:predicted lipid-binding transport protein (Tim44 family)